MTAKLPVRADARHGPAAVPVGVVDTVTVIAGAAVVTADNRTAAVARVLLIAAAG